MPGVVQSNSVFNDASGTTLPCSLSAPVGQGNGVFVIGDTNNNLATTCTITDDKGNTYTQIDSMLEAVDAIRWIGFYCPDASGAQTFTMNCAASTFRRIIVIELSGVSGIDVHAGQYVSTPGTTATSPSVTTTQDGDLVIGYMICAQAMTFSAPWNQAALLEGAPVCIYQVQSTKGAIQATWSQPSQVWAAGIVAFKATPVTTQWDGGFKKNPSSGELVSGATPSIIDGGFLRDSSGALVFGSTAPLKIHNSFLRDTNYALVKSAGPGTMQDGFSRDSSYALVTVSSASAVHPTRFQQGFLVDANGSLVVD